MMRLRFISSACVVLILFVLLAGCSLKSETHHSRSGLAEIKVRRIALMPFIKGLYDTSLGAPVSRLLYCTIGDLCTGRTAVTGDADRLMTGFLQEALQKKYGAALIPADVSRTAYSALPKKPLADTPQSLAVALGKELDAEYVMVGIVWRYKERVGTAQASPGPASVAFSLYLVNTGETIPEWMAAFDKTQQALTENLLDAWEFFRMGARWLTAEELARYGIKKTLESPGGVL